MGSDGQMSYFIVIPLLMSRGEELTAGTTGIGNGAGLEDGTDGGMNVRIPPCDVRRAKNTQRQTLKRGAGNALFDCSKWDGISLDARMARQPSKSIQITYDGFYFGTRKKSSKSRRRAFRSWIP